MRPYRKTTKSTNKTMDPIFSTYWWEMTLDPSHPKNYNPKINVMPGYSKFADNDEPKDKNYLLRRCIGNVFHLWGWLDKSHKIDVYKKSGPLLDKSTSIHILTLYRLDFDVIGDNLPSAIQSGLVTFLTKLYECRRTGKDPRYLFEKPDMKFSKDDYLNVDKVNVRSLSHLHSYAEKLIKSGHALGAVMDFVFKYKEQKLSA